MTRSGPKASTILRIGARMSRNGNGSFERDGAPPSFAATLGYFASLLRPGLEEGFRSAGPERDGAHVLRIAVES